MVSPTAPVDPRALVKAKTWQEVVPQLLEAFDGSHQANKKRITVMAMVDARISGLSYETAFALPDTCSRVTYYRKGGWHQDPVFEHVLQEVYKLAVKHQDVAQVRAIFTSSKIMAMAAPRAVAKIVSLLESKDEGIVLRAALGIADRVDVAGAVVGLSEEVNVQDAPIAEWAKMQEQSRSQVGETLNMFEEIEDELSEQEIAAGMFSDEPAAEIEGELN